MNECVPLNCIMMETWWWWLLKRVIIPETSFVWKEIMMNKMNTHMSRASLMRVKEEQIYSKTLSSTSLCLVLSAHDVIIITMTFYEHRSRWGFFLFHPLIKSSRGDGDSAWGVSPGNPALSLINPFLLLHTPTEERKFFRSRNPLPKWTQPLSFSLSVSWFDCSTRSLLHTLIWSNFGGHTQANALRKLDTSRQPWAACAGLWSRGWWWTAHGLTPPFTACM